MTRDITDVHMVLIDRRRQLGLSQQGLADKMHVSRHAIRSFEANSDPKVSSLMRYAHAVGIRVHLEVSDLAAITVT